MECNISKDKCLGCGSCISITDNKIFDFDDEGKACVIIDNKKELTEEELKKVNEAIDFCPTNAISIIDETINSEEDTESEIETKVTE